MDTSSLKGAAGLAAMVSQLVLMVVIGLWLGKQADQRFGIDPIGLMTGVFVAFGMGMWRLIRHVSRSSAGEDRDLTS